MKTSKLLKNPFKIFSVLATKGYFKTLSDEKYLKYMYRATMNKKLNLDTPTTFNEKLQWLKLYDRKSEYTMMADKHLVREYIAKELGEEYLIPLIGVWDDPDEIDFDALPNQFVLKCNHNSGLGMCICKDKSKLNIEEVKKDLRKGLEQNYYLTGREWVYKDIPRKVIAEKYMEDEIYKELRDYKFFCFNGVPKIMFVGTERQVKGEEVKFDFFDMDYKYLGIKNGHPNAKVIPGKPINYDKMKELAGILSKGIPHVRIDFYEVSGDIFFGELTFYHFSGMVPFTPEEWDYKLGEWIKLPDNK